MKTDAQRIASYLAKTVAATLSLKIAAVLGGMQSGFASTCNQLVPMEIAIQGICNADATPTIQYPFYINFGRELWKLEHKGIDGPGLIASAQSLHDKYVGYGLDTAVLVKIADQVFTITVT